MKLNDFKTGRLLHHHLYGIVKLVKFNYGTCIVLTYTLITEMINGKIVNRYGWDEITVLTTKLEKYNKLQHGTPMK